MRPGMLKLNLTVRVAICFLFVFLPLQNMDQWFYDQYFKLRGKRKQPTPFVLVRVNENKLSSLGGDLSPDVPPGSPAPSPFVWNSRFYDRLLKKIQSQEPRLIIFTSFYDWVDNPKSKALTYPNVIVSAYLNEENKLILPPSTLAAGENFGFSNIFPDSDNVVRRSYLVYSSGTSLALRAYYRLLKDPIRINLLDPIQVDYRGPGGSYTNIDAVDLFEEDVSKDFFKNKIVLVGRESTRSSDVETPFGSMSRLEVQANTIDTFLGQRQIQILPRLYSLVAAALAVGLSILIILFFPLTLAWLVLVLFALLIALVDLLLFSQFKVWMGIANPILCIFGSHLLMLGYKLSRQEAEQWKLQQESEYLKELDQFKNNFISLFSHDLKTPIAKIRAITDRVLTENRDLAQPIVESLHNIQRTNNELARLISDILKVTKMESMSLEKASEVVDLNRLIEIAVERLQFLADEKNIQIVLDLEPLFSMEGDPQLLQEVITNLLENAIKYSPPDRKVVMRTAEHDDSVRVSVIDEGEGIPPDELPRVTGKFYRGKTVADKTKGSGLGLYLSKYFVELHDGSLEIQSELGKGTSVSFSLPIR
jgi:two-component system, OmpR family, phosphate regulon sensor histidine kinase PhoR